MTKYVLLFSVLLLKESIILFGAQIFNDYYYKKIDKFPNHNFSHFTIDKSIYLCTGSSEYVIKGIIYASGKKELVTFVSIFTNDKKIITQSDANGKFEFEIPKYYFDGKTVISFSCVGYKEKKVKLKRKYITTNMDIYLKV